jgi:hypothetical protein
MSGIVYQERSANRCSGRETIQRDIQGIGRVNLVFEEEQSGGCKLYSMYRGEVYKKKSLGFARLLYSGLWTFEEFPGVTHREPYREEPSPCAVDAGGC